MMLYSICLPFLLLTSVSAAPFRFGSAPVAREPAVAVTPLDPRVKDFASIIILPSQDNFQSQDIPASDVRSTEHVRLPELLFEDADDLDSPEPEDESWDGQSFWEAMTVARTAPVHVYGQTFGVPLLRSFRELLPFLHRDRKAHAARGDDQAHNLRMV